MTEAHTPTTPWHWTIEDHSMAILSGPDSITQHVVSVSPCEICQNRADPKEWVWGRCTTIKKADAEYLVLAVNSHAKLVKVLEFYATARVTNASIESPYNCDDGALARATLLTLKDKE